MSRFFSTSILAFSLLVPNMSSADIFDKIGDVLEEARDDFKEEANRFINDVKDETRRVEARAKVLEGKIRRLRDELKDEIAKVKILRDVLLPVMDATEIAIESSGEVIQSNFRLIEQIEEAVVNQKLDPYAILIESSSNVLGNKLAEVISADKINDFLDSEVIGDIKIIDILLPIQSGLERLDPTGMQKCLRRDTVVRAASNGKMALSGAPELSFDTLTDAVSLKAAGTKVAAGCLQKHVLRKPKEGANSLSEAELAEAQTARDAVIELMRKNAEESATVEEYYDEVQDRYAHYNSILDDTKVLAIQAEAAQKENERLASELAKKLAELNLEGEAVKALSE
jgi:hypothetical protein